MSNLEQTPRKNASYPTLPLQKAFYLLETLRRGATTVVTTCELGPDLDERVLASAIDDVAFRHPALGYAFGRSRGELRQRPGGFHPPRLVVDASLLPTPEPVVLRTGDLLRVAADRSSGMVRLATSHIVADRWSLWLLQRDLEHAYRARRDGRVLSRRRTVQFGQLVADSVASHARGDFEQDLKWWREALRGLSPIAPARPQRGTEPMRALSLRLSDSNLETLRVSCRTRKTTMVGHIAALVARAIGRSFRARDVAFLSLSAGRPRRSSWDVVGCFINPFPMRFNIASLERGEDPHPSTADFVARSGPSFDRIVDALHPDDRAVLSPSGDSVLFLLHNEGSPDDSQPKAAGWPETEVIGSEPGRDWGLGVDCLIEVHLERNAAVRVTFRPGRVEHRMIEGMLLALRELIARDAQSVR